MSGQSIRKREMRAIIDDDGVARARESDARRANGKLELVRELMMVLGLAAPTGGHKASRAAGAACGPVRRS